eukprot:3086311-Rhodomonas_salina.1
MEKELDMLDKVCSTVCKSACIVAPALNCHMVRPGFDRDLSAGRKSKEEAKQTRGRPDPLPPHLPPSMWCPELTRSILESPFGRPALTHFTSLVVTCMCPPMFCPDQGHASARLRVHTSELRYSS